MRRLALIALAAVGLLAIVLAALPRLVSSDAVRNALVERAREITGRTMQFSGQPMVKFSPYLGIEIHNVVFRDEYGPKDAPPILQMPVLASKLGIAAALRGAIEFTEFEFIRPEFNLTVYESGRTSWTFPEGMMWQALSEAHELRLATASGETPDMSGLANVGLGTFSVSDGLVRYENRSTGREENITSLNGTLTWRSVRSPLEYAGGAIWRGEAISGRTRIATPIMLLAGGASELAFNIQSEPITVTFDGEANRLSNFFLSGQTTIGSKSLRRMASFLGGKVGPGTGFEAFSASGAVSGTLADLQFANSTIDLDGNRYSGNLRFTSVENGRNKLSGTLAADTLNLMPYASLVTDAQNRQTIFSILEQTDADLRISANTISASGISLREFAGGLIGREKELSIDIGNAAYGDAIMAGSLSAKAIENDVALDMSLDASSINLAGIPFIKATSRMLPDGPSHVSLKLKSNSPQSAETGNLLSGLGGEFELKMKSGSITGFDISELLKSLESGSAGGGTMMLTAPLAATAVRDLLISARISNGTAWIQESGFKVGEREASLFGKTNLSSGALAIWGGLGSSKQAGPVNDHAQFFIGGTLNQPLFVPQIAPGGNRGSQPAPDPQPDPSPSDKTENKAGGSKVSGDTAPAATQ